MSDKAILAVIIGAVLAGVVGGFAYIWHHIEDNSTNSKTARIIQNEIVMPTLKEYEGRIRHVEKCGQDCN